jgi:DNA (cytosine-5)-methyltransferase 1
VPLLVDLFCGAGGTSMGYHRAGLRVIGVDIDPQPDYPFEFVRRNALDVLSDIAAGRWTSVIHAIHAGPPCQAKSVMSKSWNGKPDAHPQLIAPVRELLERIGCRTSSRTSAARARTCAAR